MEDGSTALRWRHQSHDGVGLLRYPFLNGARGIASKSLHPSISTEGSQQQEEFEPNIRAAVDHFDNKAFRVKTFLKEEESEDYRYYQILRDHCSISLCKRLITSSASSPVTKIYTAMALIQGGSQLSNSSESEERIAREEALEEVWNSYSYY